MLERLELRGFKSFSERTVLEFGPGINVIVGPNGSGKSNLVEAVGWALGEQRPGQLRAGGMLDVLYSGDETRPAAPLAEVALTVGAPDGADPAPPERGAQMQVARRLTRAGDAAYRLNEESCRLLDVQDALAGHGLGPRSLSIIRQGRVDAICASRPSELRAMVDEAAGVAGAKRRRRRAGAKLNRIGERLGLAREMAGELDAQARRLRRQAGAAERAAEIEGRIAAVRRALAGARVAAAQGELDGASARVEELQAAAGAAAAGSARAEEARAAAEAARAAGAADLAAAGALAVSLRASAERLAGRAELARERLAAAAAEGAGRARRRERAGAALERGEADLASRLVERRAADERVERAAQAAQAAERDAEVAQRELRAVRDRVSGADAAGAAARLALEAARSEGERAEARRVRAVEQAAATPVAADDRDARRTTVTAGRVERGTAALDRARAVAADDRAAAEVAEQRLREVRGRAELLAPLAEAAAAGAALGAGVRPVPGGERALAAALGPLAEAVVRPDLDEAQRAIAEGASAALIPGSGDEPVASIGRPAISLVGECPAAIRPHLERLLAGIRVVDSLAEVPADAPGTFVTSDGRALRPRLGLVSGEHGPWLRAAQRELAERAAVAAEREATVARRRAQGSARAEAATAARARAAEASHERARRRQATAQAAAAALAERIGRAAAEVADAELAIAAARAEAERAQAEIGLASAAAGDGRAELDAAQARANVTATGWRDAQIAAADASADAVAARAAETELRAQVAAWQEVARGPGAPSFDLDWAAEALAAAAAAVEPKAGEAIVRAERLAAAGADHDAGLATTAATARAAGEAVAAATAAVHEAALAQAVARERRDEAARAAALAPPVGDDDDPDAIVAEPTDPAELAERLADLEDRRARIGAVNPLAAGEMQEIDARQADLLAQIEDLERTATALREHLGELDARVASGFEAAFGAVRERFGEMVGLLFPGGAGRLRAVRDEDDEEGIAVEVVPAGKSPRSLELLSGGERSLVALAFCLALAMARPAPFYLLDEVEAALDDANLRRLLAVLRRLGEDTQFVLVTHQQPTVEIADTLFGVTMGAGGVSQVLARRLDRAVEGPAREFVRRTLRAIPGGAG